MFLVRKIKKDIEFIKIKLLFFGSIKHIFRLAINHKVWFAVFFITIIAPSLIKPDAFISVQEGTEKKGHILNIKYSLFCLLYPVFKTTVLRYLFCDAIVHNRN